MTITVTAQRVSELIVHASTPNLRAKTPAVDINRGWFLCIC